MRAQAWHALSTEPFFEKPYVAAKWGLLGLTENIAATLGRSGIRCNAICPTVVAIAADDRPDRIWVGGEPALSSQHAPHAERPAGTTPEQVAAAVRFLASDEALHINGAALPIDNGWLTQLQ